MESSGHDVYNRGQDIDRALPANNDEAAEKKAQLVEIMPGKGSGQLEKRVLRFLDQKEIKGLYDKYREELPQLREGGRQLPMEVTVSSVLHRSAPDMSTSPDVPTHESDAQSRPSG